MAVDIDKLQIEIEASSSDAAKKIRELAKELERLKKVVGGGGNGLGEVKDQIKEIENAAGKATKSFGFFKSALKGIGVRRIANYLGGAVASMNEYVETMNLFQVSMGKFYDDAKSYAELVNQKLGVDPAQWMRTQGVFMSMGKGFGMAEEQAYNLSEGLTELSYDISSLYNEDIESAATRLQSALAGEIEPIRRLGISISQATLQEYAMAKGIKESVSDMTEQEKALLRSLKLIEDAGKIGAVGDFAKTLESPANAVRVLTQQFEQLKRTIGSVFLPIVIQSIPYVQAFTSVLTDMIAGLATLVGFEMPVWDNNKWSETFDSAASSVGDATAAVKELKRQTIGIDELNILKDGGGGTGGSGSDWAANLEIPDLWNKAEIEKISTKASEIKEKLEPILDLALKIGAALLALKIADSTFTAVSDLRRHLFELNGEIDGISKGRLLTIGITLAITGVTLEWDAIFDAWVNGMDWENLAQITIGEGGVIAGGATIGAAFGKALIGSAIGGIVASAPALVTSIYDAINNGFNTKNGLSIITNAAVLGAGIGGLIAGPVGAGVGAAIGAAVGAVTDLAIYIGQNWDQIKKEAKSDWEAMQYQWEDTIRVFGEALELGKQKIEEAFGPFWSQLKEEAKAEWDRTVTYWEDFWGDISTGWNDFKSAFSEGWDKFWQSAGETVDGMINGVISAVESGLNWCINALNTLSWAVPDWVPEIGGKKFGFSIDPISLGRVDFFENGGFPNRGQMFIARERGPELVGQIGSRTAIANNDQIVSGIASGVSDANEGVINAVMSIGYMIVNAIEEQGASGGSVDLYSIARALHPYSKRVANDRGASLVNA